MEAHEAPHPRDSPGRNTGVGCHLFLHKYIYIYICIYKRIWPGWGPTFNNSFLPSRTRQVLQVPSHFGSVQHFEIVMNYSLPGFLVHGFSRQEYWSGCHALLQGIFPIQGSSPHLFWFLHWQASSSATWEAPNIQLELKLLLIHIDLNLSTLILDIERLINISFMNFAACWDIAYPPLERVGLQTAFLLPGSQYK